MEKKMTFNEIPELYEKARPTYPEVMINDIIRMTDINKSSKILEIGSGTGQATTPFAKVNLDITCIEIGRRTAEFAKAKFKSYKNVHIINSSFEKWDSNGRLYDLIFSAQAFHWIDPIAGYNKVYDLLKDTGYFALIWLIHPYPDTEFFKELEELYLKIVPEIARDKNVEPVEDQMKKKIREIKDTGLFNMIDAKKYYYEIEYDADLYIELLNTYSDHILLKEESKNNLYNAIRKLIEKYGGKFKKPYVATLYISCKK